MIFWNVFYLMLDYDVRQVKILTLNYCKIRSSVCFKQNWWGFDRPFQKMHLKDKTHVNSCLIEVDSDSPEHIRFCYSQELTKILKEKLLREGRRPYVIPVGGSNSLGTWWGWFLILYIFFAFYYVGILYMTDRQICEEIVKVTDK